MPAAEPQSLTAASAAWSFFAGLGGAAIPLSVMWVKLQLDQLSARCDAFGTAVETAVELAIDYWLTGVPANRTPPTENSDEGRARDAEHLKHEVKLRGAQAVLQADVARMARDLPKNYREDLRAEFVQLIQTLTGGRFGDRDGHNEPHRAQAAVASGARIIRIVREGRDETSRLGNMFLFVTGLRRRS